jgi:hypothetical protein
MELFDYADQNKDMRISVDEMQKFLERMDYN